MIKGNGVKIHDLMMQYSLDSGLICGKEPQTGKRSLSGVRININVDTETIQMMEC
jgi:hypothetical protein